MADFTTAMTSVADVDDSIIRAYDAGFIMAAQQADVMTPFVQYRASFGADAIKFPKYAALSATGFDLVDKEDPASEAVTDTAILITPTEKGKVVTKTTLASLQTGGKIDLAIPQLVGANLARAINITAIRAAEATTNVVYGGTATAPGNVGAGDVMSKTVLEKVYNKMARASIPTMPGMGLYVAFMHDDVISDLRSAAAAGDWTDVNKYGNPAVVLNNAVSVYKGFLIVRNNDCAFADQTGAGTVDEYVSSFVGFNGLGRGVSLAPGLRFTSTDKLQRFINVGWYGVWADKIVDSDAVWKAVTSSSLGANS